MSSWVYLKNGFVPEKNALLSYRDLSIQRGYGIFDFFRVSGNIPVFLEQHLERFMSSASGMHLPVKENKGELKQLITDLIRKNDLAESGIRLTLTGGESYDGYSIGEPALIISQHLFNSPTPEQFRKGIRLVTYEHQRQLSAIKTIDYAMAIWLQPYIQDQGGDDVLYYSNQKITECPRANFFLVTKDETLVTPGSNILKGITRQNLIRLASRWIPVEERDIDLEELRTAKEAFITSTTKQVLPVVQIDGHTFSSQNPITDRLNKDFRDLLQETIHHTAD